MAEGEKPKEDVEELFKKLGSKLGWFQYKDVNSAIQSLSQSGKKKASRSRISDRSTQKINVSKNSNKKVGKKSQLSETPKENESKKVVNQIEYREEVESSTPEDCSSPESEVKPLIESTRIGISMLQSESNSFVNLSLSPVQFASGVNLSGLDGSYEALNIGSKAGQRNQSELDTTDKNFATCYPADEDVFYSVLIPDDKTNTSDLTCSDQSEYVEVHDKAVSTGSLELKELEKAIDEISYEQDRTYFTSWAVNDNVTDDGLTEASSTQHSITSLPINQSHFSGKGGVCIESFQNTDHSNQSEDESDVYEVEDKCIGTEGKLSETSPNLSPAQPANTTTYFDSTDTQIPAVSDRRSSVAEKSVYYDVSDVTLPTEPNNHSLTQESRSKKSGPVPVRKGVWSESSDEEDLDDFFVKMRTPLRERLTQNSVSSSLNDFIVDDEDETSDDNDQAECNSGFFHVNVDRKIDTPKKCKPKNNSSTSTAVRRHVIEISDSDEENSPFRQPKSSQKDVFKTPKPVTGSKSTSGLPRSAEIPDKVCTFLKSLSPTLPEYQRNTEANRFVRQFSKTREELVKKLFILYNTTVFDNKLPLELPIKWNSRLLKTAGYCKYLRSKSGSECRSVEIELSTKVCDSTERVRDTLIHELCHAAVWLINGTRDGHGPYWKYWAKKSNYIHPELPIINRCHNYSINTKYLYKCVQCGYQIGRHSKSLDTSRKVCGLCHGKFELLLSGSQSTPGGATPKTPRTANKFAMFVKENYKDIKQRNSDYKHKDVMAALSKEFAEKNKLIAS